MAQIFAMVSIDLKVFGRVAVPPKHTPCFVVMFLPRAGIVLPEGLMVFGVYPQSTSTIPFVDMTLPHPRGVARMVCAAGGIRVALHCGLLHRTKHQPARLSSYVVEPGDTTIPFELLDAFAIVSGLLPVEAPRSAENFDCLCKTLEVSF